MSGAVGGRGGADPRIGAEHMGGADAVEGAGSGPGAAAGEAAGGAPGALRSARPKSLDMTGLGLAASLSAKLDAASGATASAATAPLAGASATGPSATAATPATTPAATPVTARPLGRPISLGGIVRPNPVDPRPHVGAVDAKVIEDLIAKKDAVGMTNEIFARARNLFVCDGAGLRLAPGASEGDVNRFKVFLDVVASHGKLGDFRKFLSEAPPSSVLLDGKTLGFGVNADDILSLLVQRHAPRGIQRTWAQTPPPPTPPNAGLVDAQVIEARIDAGDAAGAANELLCRARALFVLDASGARLRPSCKPGEVQRFKQMLQQLEDHAKIPDLRQLLGRAAGDASVQVDGAPLPSGVTPDDIGNILVHAFGTPSQQLRWDRAPPP
jgi:hypothetical protein